MYRSGIEVVMETGNSGSGRWNGNWKSGNRSGNVNLKKCRSRNGSENGFTAIALNFYKQMKTVECSENSKGELIVSIEIHVYLVSSWNTTEEGKAMEIR